MNTILLRDSQPVYFKRSSGTGPMSFLLSVLDKIQKKPTIEEKKTALIKELNEARIDSAVFDKLISNEIDRKLKTRFGFVFLFFTFLFTAASYSIVILDAIYDWNISQIAITALKIETPIQFIGLFPEVTQFHALRHTYTTSLIDACKDLAVAQAQLGHVDIRTTMRYSDMTADRKRKAVKMLNYGLKIKNNGDDETR